MLDPLRELLGGGTLTLWLIGGGLVALWLAVKAVKVAVRIVALVAGAGLLVGTAPWSGEALDGEVASCASQQVEYEAGGWQQVATKRVTVEELSGDAACADDGRGLRRGTATVRLRTWFDVPFQTWTVTDAGAESSAPISGLGG